MPMAAAESVPPGVVGIRAADAEDAATLADLAAQLGYAGSADAMRSRLAQVDGVVLVAVREVDGSVLGFAHVRRHAGLLAMPYGWLQSLVVDAASRGRGAGAALLAAVEAWARAEGLHELRVDSNVARERSHRFYLRQGYVERKRQCVFVRALEAG